MKFIATAPVGIYLFKVNNGKKNNVWNLFKVNSIDPRMGLLTLNISHIVLVF